MRPLVNAVTRHTIVTAVFAFALAASVAAAPQRGGGSSGGRSGGGHPSGEQSGGGQGPGHSDGRPHTDGPRGHHDRAHSHIFVGGRFYDPFWGPFYPYGYGYPYGYAYPYGYPDGPYDISGNLKTDITPKQTEVYVDGYYAGVADDFDGIFQQLDVSPGGHAVTLHLEGYRTITRNIYVQPDSTSKLKETMEKLAPGEVADPVTPPGRSDGTIPTPDVGSAPQR